LILINGNWEKIETLRDASRVVREYYNRELADEIDELIDMIDFKIEELEEYKYMYEDLC
jgi:hypothetical protein